MSEWVFDAGKASKYLLEIAQDQNSEERMNLERIAGALNAMAGKSLPTIPSRDAPVLVMDERNGIAFAIEAGALELIEANGEPHAKLVVPEGFVLLSQMVFDALGGGNPAPNPIGHPDIDVLVSDGFAAIVRATYEGLDETGAPIYQLTDGATIHPAAHVPPADAGGPINNDPAIPADPLAADLASQADPAGVTETLGDAYKLNDG